MQLRKLLKLLKEQVEKSLDFRRIADFVMSRYGKKVVLPKEYKINRWTDEDGDTHSDLEDIVNINHQIICSNLDELLEDLVNHDRNLLDEVLREDTVIGDTYSSAIASASKRKVKTFVKTYRRTR